MIVNATQIRVGMILLLDAELYRVLWTMHRTPGKGNACMQTKLKHVLTGKNLEKRFLSTERVERATLDSESMQYLYQEPDALIFMNNETFEQISVSKELLADGVLFLKEGDNYDLTFYESQVVSVQLPLTVNLEVTYAAPEVRKATATSSLRPVEVENGMTIQAPAFIKTGDVIKINTETMSYVERVSI
ncbi:MAG: elongation factor P [bacterium]